MTLVDEMEEADEEEEDEGSEEDEKDEEDEEDSVPDDGVDVGAPGQDVLPAVTDKQADE